MPKYMAGAMRNWKWVLRRNSPSTPTVKPGSHRSWSTVTLLVTSCPFSSVKVTCPAFSSSRSCKCVPTITPKWKGRKSQYGRFSTVRSCAIEARAVRQQAMASSHLWGYFVKIFMMLWSWGAACASLLLIMYYYNSNANPLILLFCGRRRCVPFDGETSSLIGTIISKSYKL